MQRIHSLRKAQVLQGPPLRDMVAAVFRSGLCSALGSIRWLKSPAEPAPLNSSKRNLRKSGKRLGDRAEAILEKVVEPSSTSADGGRNERGSQSKRKPAAKKKTSAASKFKDSAAKL